MAACTSVGLADQRRQGVAQGVEVPVADLGLGAVAVAAVVVGVVADGPASKASMKPKGP